MEAEERAIIQGFVDRCVPAEGGYVLRLTPEERQLLSGLLLKWEEELGEDVNTSRGSM